MPISLVTNFDVNASSPIDSRMVVADTTQRNNIVYKYQGLKVYQTNDNSSWVWNGSSWTRDGNGIYGGSGSLVGYTSVDFGNLGSTIGSVSNTLSWSSGSGNLNQYFLRHSLGNESNGYETSLYSIEYNTYNVVSSLVEPG